MNKMGNIVRLILLVPILLLSLSLHEFSHAKVSDLLGDPTPRMTGRLTINPLPHLDPVGTLLPVLGILFGLPLFGWAKPVQVNPNFYNDREKGMMLVGLAGPLSNIILAIFLGVLFKLFTMYVGVIQNFLVVYIFFYLGISLNITLAIFNLLPVPPLDGSKILGGLLPRNKKHILYDLEAYGPFFLMFFFFTGLIGRILSPILNFSMNLLFNVLQIGF